MKLSDLKDILYSRRGEVQFAILYDMERNIDIDAGSVGYVVSAYGDKEVKHIEAFENQLIISVID